MASNRTIYNLLHSRSPLSGVTVQGWVRTRRDARGFSFLELNDGSCLANLQIVVDGSITGYEHIERMSTGASVFVTGELVESPGKGQQWELRAGSIRLIGASPGDYPLQKKRHSDEFLRTIAHLRPRTNRYGAMLRIRSRISLAVHDFFREKGFFCIHTPVITGSDCEGAGDLFRITTLDPANVPLNDGKVDYDRDFFAREAALTVSGQLAAEACCLALGKVYTFGPAFRAENSNTSRHVAEFWMIEPEMAFADLDDNMLLGQDLIRHLVRYSLEHCSEDMDLFARFVDKALIERLETVIAGEFPKLSYTDAIDILQNSGQKFEFRSEWGKDLQTEHERFLTEVYFSRPVIVYDYPKDIKAFYMRQNNDAKTVAAMDILVPSIGEIIGGSQREERLDRLTARISELGLQQENYWWYLETRKYGSVPHAGFGLGFERFLMLLTGTTNIRDVIPFPRTPRHLEF